jgi:hypothetical protein
LHQEIGSVDAVRRHRSAPPRPVRLAR